MPMVSRYIRHFWSTRGVSMKRFVPLTVAALAFVACQDASAPKSEMVRTAPQAVSEARNTPIPGDYIVTLRDDVGDVAAAAQSISAEHH